MQAKVSSAAVSHWLFAAALVRIGLDCVRHRVDAWPDVWQHEAMFYVGGVFMLLAILARWTPRCATLASLACYASIVAYFLFTVGQYVGLWIWFELADLALLCGAFAFARGGGRVFHVAPVTIKAKWLQCVAWFFFSFALLPTGVAVLAFAIRQFPDRCMSVIPAQVQVAVGVVACTLPLLTFTECRRLRLASLGCALTAVTVVGILFLAT